MPGTAGASGESAGAGGSSDGESVAAPRLVLFYTRWGTAYPEWWPSGAGADFQLGTVLAPLEPFKDRLTIVSGLANVTLDTTGVLRPSGMAPSPDAEGPRTLLTAQPAPELAGANGPSIDSVIGDCGGAAGPPVRLRVGEFMGGEHLYFDANGEELASESDPQVAARRWLESSIEVPNAGTPMEEAYPALGLAQMKVLVGALAARKACVGTLSWGDAVVPAWLGESTATSDIHNLSHTARSLYAALSSPITDPNNPFAILQRWYARQFAALLASLAATPFADGNLLDHSVVVWLSESGQGDDHTGSFIPVVLAGNAAGRLRVGGFVEVHPRDSSVALTVGRTQGDLLRTVSTVWNVPAFGSDRIARDGIRELLP